jgi:hypothetical protein
MIFIFSAFLGRENGPSRSYNAYGGEFDDRDAEKDWLRWWVRCGMEIGEGILCEEPLNNL